MSNWPRQCGIILHPTSLPSPYGIGEMGRNATQWIDQLVEMGQSIWQILPIGPTSYGDSPYQCLSTFAGNKYWIGLEELVDEGLLEERELEGLAQLPCERVDFGAMFFQRLPILAQACDRFLRKAQPSQLQEFDKFCRDNRNWLEDYSLYMALKNAHEGAPWTQWDTELVQRNPDALDSARDDLQAPIQRERVAEFLFEQQWKKLKNYAAQRGITIMGDIPIFVAHDSADVWAHPELFHLDEAGQPTVIAGVPPDYFSATGQRWGNPLYRWDRLGADGFAWWIRRLRKVLERVDWLKIDHFRGFESYWEIPASEPTAIHGKWVPGPRAAFFEALRGNLGELPIAVEDLGIITDEVKRLRDRFELPGMRVLQFAFGTDALVEDYIPENYIENCVAYTGTHDNDTTVGYFHSQAGEGTTRSQEDIDRERANVLAYFGTDGSEIQWDFISKVLHSRARMALYPLQDVLGLGTEARMNTPGVPDGNWTWRFNWDQLTPELRERLRNTTLSAQRVAPAAV